jgi:hypothetical protein
MYSPGSLPTYLLWPRIWARKMSSVWFLGLKRWQQMAP